MAAYGGTTAAVESLPNLGVKRVFIYTQDDAVTGDQISVTLADYGIGSAGLLAVQGWTQTTNGSVIVSQTGTTSVTSGVLTMTAAGTGVTVLEITGLVKPDYTSA